MLPSGPHTMPSGPAFGVGTGNSVISPDGVIRPILLAAFSQNHSAPSPPGAMPTGRLFGVGVGNSAELRSFGFSRPIFDAPFSQNHRLPSRPATMR